MTDPESDKMRDLRRRLDWELSLGTDELVSHGWYHGPLDRAKAEALTLKDGNFVVRDSSTQPGHYVLSCRHGGHCLHFVINRVVIRPDTVYEHFQYQFEDEPFESVPDLVRSYVGSGRPISHASNAKIQTPVNRTGPLLNSNPKGAVSKVRVRKGTGSSSKGKSSSAPKASGHSSVKSNVNGSSSSRVSNEANHTVNIISFPRKYKNDCDIGHNCPYSANRPHTRPESKKHSSHSKGKYMKKANCRVELNPDESSESDVPDYAPNKPRRNFEVNFIEEDYPTEYDSGNGSGDSVYHWLTTKKNIDAAINFIPIFDSSSAEKWILQQVPMECRRGSVIDTKSFITELFLDQDNKPLASDTLHTIKVMLNKTGASILACHLTRIDRDFILAPHDLDGKDILDKLIGLELYLLPDGDKMRSDIVERAECMKFMVIITILTCQDDDERAQVLKDWIELAKETRNGYGNLFGFSLLMWGLCSDEVKGMESTWSVLRKKHTLSAFAFESKLAPAFRRMNDGVEPTPPNITLPHIMPAVDLLTSRASPGLKPSWLEHITNYADYGMTIMGVHLEAARFFTKSLSIYFSNAKTCLSALPTTSDNLLLDLFKTEFHMKFLWGANGAAAGQRERHDKLNGVVKTMLEKFQSN